MGDNSGKKCYILVLLCILLIFGGIFTPMLIESINKYNSYEEAQCFISKIEYPQNYVSRYMWGKCRCGKRCYAYSPIIKMYTKVDNGFKMANESILINTGMEEFPYTFFNSICMEGNRPGFVEKSIKWSNQTYENNINQTITCYISGDYDKAIITLEDTLESSVFYTIVVILSIIVCCIGCTCLCLIN